MKISRRNILLLLLLLPLFTITATAFHHHSRYNDLHCLTTTTTISDPKHPCFNYQGLRLLQPRPTSLPMPPRRRLDPRNGVAKRLVPSGPNRLHNHKSEVPLTPPPMINISWAPELKRLKTGVIRFYISSFKRSS
ncbi:hypothetical protein QVD17_35510 [Tagetes erecta]|uniref:Uncharacterized protein n=1 Tax=Tagetes erecta TaxID=13708 RepID=A0AAD8NMF7_TARER|nr:hypothetical protein QVD17_35510 [Tagetes erecta]